MTKTELKIRIDMHRRELKGLERIEVGCRTCEHYALPECDKWNSAPPPDIVASGCDEWTYDFIPF